MMSAMPVDPFRRIPARMHMHGRTTLQTARRSVHAMLIALTGYSERPPTSHPDHILPRAISYNLGPEHEIPQSPELLRDDRGDGRPRTTRRGDDVCLRTTRRGDD